MNTIDICAICAWRATCQKKFSISGRDMRCPDFVKDLEIENSAQEEEDQHDTKGEA